MKKDKELVKFDGKIYKKKAFMIEEDHPAIGRILIVEGIKFKILDPAFIGGHRQGTYLKRMSEDDEEIMREYDEAVDELSSKLIQKVDIKKVIKENLKGKSMQDIKTGLYILNEQEKGNKIEEEHIKGCYQYNMHYGKQTFSFLSGNDIQREF